MLSRYPAVQVAPLSLLVPIVGFASSSLLPGERPSAAQITGAALVMGGLAVNVSSTAFIRRLGQAAVRGGAVILRFVRARRDAFGLDLHSSSI